MKKLSVLFVSGGNSSYYEISPFIKIQGDSLGKFGVDTTYYTIKEGGIKGYIKNGFKLRELLKENKFDLIHAHYTLSGWSAVIGAGKIPVILSLMGSDAYGEYIDKNKTTIRSSVNTILTKAIQPFVKAIISKSSNIEKYVIRKKISHIQPNGIELSKFSEKKVSYRLELGLDNSKKYVLFLGNKNNIRKNYLLAQTAVSIIGNSNVELLMPYPIKHEMIPKYIKSSNVLVLTSFAEGSSNVLKEAMACNIPIVSTNVGDVEWLFKDLKGCYIAGFDAYDFADKIVQALRFSDKIGFTKGRNRLLELGLDSDTVAKNLIKIYKKVLG